MKSHAFSALIAGVTLLTTLAAAEKQKSSSVADYPFWTAPKRGDVRQFVPGLNAALQLTNAQKEQIAAAREEMANDEGVKAARSMSKFDPSVTAEQREKARAALDAATKKMRDKVDVTLTSDQKTLIEKINATFASAVEETGILYADRFASVKGDEAGRQRLQEEIKQATETQFREKLDRLLTANQKEAMTRAAAEEGQADAKAAASKK
jgi:hypothetical protein